LPLTKNRKITLASLPSFTHNPRRHLLLENLMRYLSHTPSDIHAMLNTIQKSSIESLFDSIPKNARLNRDLDLPKALSEIELKKALQKKAGHAPSVSFLGAGAASHFVPEIVSQLLLRGEWLTAYTPYQPEVSQGTLQAIFEFQTFVASLLGSDIANASMYDGATALAEALLMSARLKPNAKKILISRAVHPEYREVCQTLLTAAGLDLIEIPLTIKGTTNIITLKNQLEAAQGHIAAIAYQTPNFLGQLESQSELIDLAHSHQLLSVVANTDPVAFGAIQSPGNLGADIVISEGLGLCGHLSLGAPGVGLFATKQQYLRQMPGRLCGATLDSEGNRGFVLTLSTREQHIRREKATSNICTNHNLMALAFTITASLYGKAGFKKLAKHNLQKTIYFRQQAQKMGLHLLFEGLHFNETVIQFAHKEALEKTLFFLQRQDIFAGVPIEKWYPEYPNSLLVNTTELHSDADIHTLTQALSQKSQQS
jgi:glycine dehydrogenase subunit 1